MNSNLSAESLELQAGLDRSGLVDCAFTINARIWNGDQKQSATFSADNLVLSAARLRELRDRIEAWLGSTQVGTAAFSGEYSLAADGYSRLDLIFGPRKDVIASNDKPVVTVGFNVGRVSGEFWFVTDQSCLRLFVDDVIRALPDV